MKFRISLAALLALAFSFAASAAETVSAAPAPAPAAATVATPAAAPVVTPVAPLQLAVAEPVARGDFQKNDVEMLWSMLEASVSGGYQVISRSALKQLMTEIELASSSQLLELSAEQKSRFGAIKGVNCLLVPTLGRFGTRTVLTLMVLDASTGEIDPARKCVETVESIDEIPDRLPDMLQQIGLAGPARRYGCSALLAPVVKVPAPPYLPDTLNIGLESHLLAHGIKLNNLKTITPILERNKIGDLSAAEPALFARVGTLLRADYLVQVVVTRFSLTAENVYIPVTRSTVVRRIGNIEGHNRIIAGATGMLQAAIPFRLSFDFSDLTIDTSDWAEGDYGRFLIDQIIPPLAAETAKQLK